MPAILTNNTEDAFDSLVRRYLTVDGLLHAEAYEVVVRWYTYLNALANAQGNQLGKAMPAIGITAVDLAFETPVIGFLGNNFWQTHGNRLLPLICHDMVQLGNLPSYAAKPDLVVAINVMSRYSFIGQVIAFVQKDGLASWRKFEVELRALLELLWRTSLGN
jgi:hypothetical protein